MQLETRRDRGDRGPPVVCIVEHAAVDGGQDSHQRPSIRFITCPMSRLRACCWICGRYCAAPSRNGAARFACAGPAHAREIPPRAEHIRRASRPRPVADARTEWRAWQADHDRCLRRRRRHVHQPFPVQRHVAEHGIGPDAALTGQRLACLGCSGAQRWLGARYLAGEGAQCVGAEIARGAQPHAQDAAQGRAQRARLAVARGDSQPTPAPVLRDHSPWPAE